jgi:FkbM family methyltransferase
MLSFYGTMDRLFGHAEPECSELGRLVARRMVAIDVGANRGAYTYEMAKLFSHVWAFEPNEIISLPIKAARLPNVTLESAALSSEDGEGSLLIPSLNGQLLSGWASLELPGAQADGFTTVRVRKRTLDSYDIRDVCFVKIDVEGHEMAVLSGAVNTITRERPICLIEDNVGDAADLGPFFQKLGYRLHREHNGIRLSKQNVLFVPD